MAPFTQVLHLFYGVGSLEYYNKTYLVFGDFPLPPSRVAMIVLIVGCSFVGQVESEEVPSFVETPNIRMRMFSSKLPSRETGALESPY